MKKVKTVVFFERIFRYDLYRLKIFLFLHTNWILEGTGHPIVFSRNSSQMKFSNSLQNINHCMSVLSDMQLPIIVSFFHTAYRISGIVPFTTKAAGLSAN